MMDDEKAIGLSDYVSAMKRRLRLVVFVSLPLAVLGAAITLALPSVYRSTGLVQVEEAKIAGYISTTQGGGRSYVDQYVSSLTERVLGDDKLGVLAASQDFYPKLKGNQNAIIGQLRKDLRLQMVTSRILDPESGREREVISAFRVSYDNRDPHKAQAGAEWLANAYLEENRETHRRKAQGAAGFLSTESAKYRDLIEDAERRLAAFKQKNTGRLPELTNINMNVLDNAQRDLEGVNMQIQALQRDRVFMQQQLNQSQLTSPDADRIPRLEEEYREKAQTYDESHPDLISLRKQIEALRSSGAGGMSLQAQLDAQRQALAQALTRYSADHPDVKVLERRIKTLEARIAAGEKSDTSQTASAITVQLRTQLNAIDTQLAGLQSRALDLRSKAAMVESRIVSTPEVEREYKEITRDLELAHTKYDQLQKQQMDAEVNTRAISGGAADEFRLVETPSVPGSPAKPMRLALILVSLVAAFLIAATVGVMREMFDSTVRGSRDLRAIFSEAPLAVVPAIYSDATRRKRNFQALAYGFSVLLVGSALFAAVHLMTA